MFPICKIVLLKDIGLKFAILLFAFALILLFCEDSEINCEKLHRL